MDINKISDEELMNAYEGKLGYLVWHKKAIAQFIRRCVKDSLVYFLDNESASLTIHILRNWSQEKIEKFARHLLGDEAQKSSVPEGLSLEEIKNVISECIKKEIEEGYKEGGIYPEVVAMAIHAAQERKGKNALPTKTQLIKIIQSSARNEKGELGIGIEYVVIIAKAIYDSLSVAQNARRKGKSNAFTN